MNVKKLLLIFLTVALAGMTACKKTGDVSGDDGTTAGSNTGSALVGLYNQYKTDGKVDLGNLNNLTNILSLAASVTDIKNAEKGTNYYTTFASGLITGSTQKVNNNNVDNVISGLTTIDYNTLTDKSASASDKTVSALGSLTNVLNLLN